ncbi:hypothetical protein ACFSR7_07520 [Cohnella sp. GCM10020058]|uniref:hypothetical protein n=1 Tax=Cohnella sp. GCM10020058 TaxID=3317330 RepID=UPI0036447D87
MRTMNKVATIVVAVTALLATSAVVFANNPNVTPSWMNKADADIEQSIQTKKAALGDVPQANYEADGYSEFISQAKSREQTEALTALQKDNSFGIGVWKREALRIIGQLPQTSTRLSVEDVKRVISTNSDIESVAMAFNRIAGAPDWEGGSGIARSIYFTDDLHKELIVIMLGKVLYVIIDENGKQQVKDLVELKQQETPKPTTAPSL